MKLKILIVLMLSYFNISTKNIITKELYFDLNKKNLSIILSIINPIYKDEIYTLIMFETGHLTSEYCIKYNNLFGMKYPFKRDTKFIEGKVLNKNLSYYSHWINSIEDFNNWFEEHNKKDSIKNNELFIDYIIRKNFNTYSFYKKRFNKIKKYINDNR